MKQLVLQIFSKCCCYFIFYLYEPSRTCCSGAWTLCDVATTLDSLWGWWRAEFGVHSVEGTISCLTINPLLCLWMSFRLVPLYHYPADSSCISNISADVDLNLYSSHRRHKDTFGIHANTLDIWNWLDTLFHLWEYFASLPNSLLTHLLWGITVTTINITPLICSFKFYLAPFSPPWQK